MNQMTHPSVRPPLPPFTSETAIQKVRMAEDAWNTRDPEKVSFAYTEDSCWRNRAEFVQGLTGRCLLDGLVELLHELLETVHIGHVVADRAPDRNRLQLLGPHDGAHARPGGGPMVIGNNRHMR